MRRLVPWLCVIVVAVSACTSGAGDPTPLSTSGASVTTAGPPAPATGRDATTATAPSSEARQVLSDAANCSVGLRTLLDHPYVYPADPAAPTTGPDGTSGPSWVEVYGAFVQGQLPLCNTVGEYVEGHRGAEGFSSVDAVLTSVAPDGWSTTMRDGDGVVAQGERITTYCPSQHLAQFDCEQATVRIGVAAGRATAVLTELNAALSASAAVDEGQAIAAAADPVAAEVSDGTLTVDSGAGRLAGLSFTAPDTPDELADITVAAPEPAAVPSVPDGVTPLSDFFALQGSIDEPVVVRFPVPNGVPPADVQLYSLAQVTGQVDSFWSPVALDVTYEGTAQDLVLAVSLNGFNGTAFWGVGTPAATSAGGASGGGAAPTERPSAWTGSAPPAAPVPGWARTVSSAGPRPAAAAPLRSAAAPAGVNCQLIQKTAPEGVPAPTPFFGCKIDSDPDVRISLFGWGDSAATHWGAGKGMTKEEMIGVVGDTLAWYRTHGIPYSKKFGITLEVTTNVVGYVNPTGPDRGQILHLTSDESAELEYMRGTIVHELFHHAQSQFPVAADAAPGRVNLGFSSDARSLGWLIESTAEWSIDEVYDATGLPTNQMYQGLRGLELGLAAPFNRPDMGLGDPYDKGTFIKLLNSKCPRFADNLGAVMVADLSTDPTALKNFVDSLTGSGCNFGDQLGADRSGSLAAALVYYNWATQRENRLSLLDGNETDGVVTFQASPYRFATWPGGVDAWVGQGVVSTLGGVTSLPAASATSFVVPAVPTGQVPEGKVAQLIVDTPATVDVSITSRDARFTGTGTIGPDGTQHASLQTGGVKSNKYVYPAGAGLPELFVTVANSSVAPSESAAVAVCFTIADAGWSAPGVATSDPTGSSDRFRCPTS